MSSKGWISGVAGLAVGVAVTLAYQGLRFGGQADDASTEVEEAGEPEVPRGPHGGRLLAGKTFNVEVTIYETGVEPHFRVFPYTTAGAPVAARDVQLDVTLTRLGGAVTRIPFVAEADYLRGTITVEEPHSFEARVNARYQGSAETFAYAQEEGRTTIPDAALASAGIEVATAAPGVIAPILDLPGEIVVPPTRHVEIAPRLGGVLADLRVGLGQTVAQGDVVAIVSSREFADAASRFISANERVSFTRSTLAREEDLFKRRITAEQDYRLVQQTVRQAEVEQALARETVVALGGDPVEIARRAVAEPGRLAELAVRAPRSGVVTGLMAAEGEIVAADRPFIAITDTAEVWANVQVHARDLPQVAVGQAVVVTAVGMPQTVSGRIVQIDPIVGDDTRTAIARVVVQNSSGRWRPGLFATVRVSLGSEKAAVVIPSEALQTFRDWTVVFVRVGEVFEARPVETGRTDGASVEIVEGLRPGDRYAAKNAFAVKADVLKSGASHDH
jgi:cobalt-zinc-cadmium efflux system membrane fusion protein